jgi:hypothetical protein
MVRTLAAIACCLGVAVAAGCSDPSPFEPVFPEDYALTYTEVRNCRQSGDHDLHRVRVLADPAAVEAYRDRTGTFPRGAVVIKEEYDFGDTTCSGEIIAWTAMQKLDVGMDPDLLDWTWQEVLAPSRRVVNIDPYPECASCHEDCEPPDGYDHTCTVP